MAVHFALRPRFRLDEEVAPLPRAARFELPAVAGPVAAYWAGLAVFTCALLHVIHNEKAPAQDTFSAEPTIAAAEPAPEAVAADPQASPPPEPPPTDLAVLPLATDAPESDLALETAPVAPPTVAAASHVAVLAAPPPAAAARSAARRRLPSVVTSKDPLADESLEPAIVPPERLFTQQPKREGSSEPPIARAVAAAPSRAADALSSCEAALASSSQEIDFAGRRTAPDLSRDAFAGVLENGRYLSGCSVPDQTALEICVAVRGGRARGVTVVARPANASVSQCVRRAVGALAFPHSSKLDVTRTRFEPLPRR